MQAAFEFNERGWFIFVSCLELWRHFHSLLRRPHCWWAANSDLYARRARPLSSEVSWACHNYWDTTHAFKVIFEDMQLLHLLVKLSLLMNKPSIPFACRKKATQLGFSFGWDRKNRGLVSQRVWHDKDPSLLKSHRCWAEGELITTGT